MKRTPQEKKRLSLKKDRRNAYGQADKASRKAIPRRKAAAEHANRRLVRTSLTALGAAPDESLVARVDRRVNGTRLKRWQKAPDEPLGQAVAKQLARRQALRRSR